MIAAFGPAKEPGEGTMRRSGDHILTSHVGSLSRPDALIEAKEKEIAKLRAERVV